MIQKKICMLGAYAVGKTSLVKRYVDSMFFEAYQTTVGVKIDKKTVEHVGEPVDLILWDLFGDDNFQRVQSAYLRGMAGYLLVADGTRPETLDVAADIRERVQKDMGELPYVLVLNKADLVERWTLEDGQLNGLGTGAVNTLKTSAKTGEWVERIFEDLTAAMLTEV